MQPQGIVRPQLSLSRLEGGQLRDRQSGSGVAGDPRQRGVAPRSLRDRRGSIRDQVQPARARQPRGERGCTATGAGHDQGDRRPVEHRGARRRVRSNVRADGELHAGRVRDDILGGAERGRSPSAREP